MTPLQALIVLGVIIVIVWWALRRSAAQSEKEAPKGHGEHEGHVAHEEPSHVAEAVAEPYIPVSRAEVSEPPAEPVLEKAYEPVVEEAPEPETAPIEVSERAAELPVAPAPEVKSDDLVLLEGIGPRIAGVLKNAGVNTFAQLAAMEPEQIGTILTAADERLGRLADPTSWPRQAALAAKGDMEGLQKLQDSLKAGRVS